MSIKRQTLWSLAPLLVTAAVTFFSAPLFLRYFGTEMYALFGYVTTVSAMFGFADLGLGVAVGRNISHALGRNDPAAVRRYWGTGNLIVLPVLSLVTVGFTGLAMWLGPKWFDKLSPAHIGLFRICFAINGLGLFFNYYGSYWLTISQAYLDFKFIGSIRATMSLLQIIPSVVLAWLTQNPLWVVTWVSLVGLLQLVILIWHARRHYELDMCFGSASLACAREMSGYVSKMLLGLAMGVVFGNIDRLILGKLATTAVFSPYYFSNSIALRLQSLSVSVMGPVLHNTARMAQDSHAAAAKIYNDTFTFMFEWYLFAALWLGLWHPVLLRMYLVHTMGFALGQQTALAVGPLLIPLVVACCFTSIANISGSQLASLNRMGTAVSFSIAAGLLVIAGVLIGWRIAGVVGVAYGYLFSRVALVAQDLYTIHLIKAGGWLDVRTWRKIAAQGLAAALFGLTYLILPKFSYWLLVPAALHAGLVAVWLLRQPLRKVLASTKVFGKYL